MGYRSDWQLTLAASDDKVLATALQWMVDYATQRLGPNPNISDDERAVMSEILSLALPSNSPTYTIFADGCTKCYPPWDKVIRDIHDYVDQNPELDFDYVRVGEEYNDVETEYGKGYISTGVTRTIEEPSISSIPRATPMSSPLSPVQLTGFKILTPKQEEQCQCGKMKDVGIKCWWCGN